MHYIKILKLDESNQYSDAMTKPPHTSCMKEQKILIWNNFLLEKVEHDGKIGHLFVADISFTEKQATAKQ